MLALFCGYLLAVILTLVPFSLLVQRLMNPFFSRRLESQRTYFELPSGR
jgi:heme/copper-type cytochrome/quinol oxidase subunit 4